MASSIQSRMKYFFIIKNYKYGDDGKIYGYGQQLWEAKKKNLTLQCIKKTEICM
jgi:hypothetical protein